MARSLLAALLFVAGAGSALAQAYPQGNPLLGAWQHSEPAGPGGPATTMLVRFLPDQSFETRWAIPPTPQGDGGGFVVLTGRYRMTGPDSYDSISDQAFICPAGMGCTPYPAGAPQLGIGQTMHFTFQMQSPALMTVNGMSWYRQE